MVFSKHSALIGGSVVLCGLLLAAGRAASPQGASATAVAVRTTRPQRVTLKRTTAQPATVRAYFEAEIYAKVAGYLRALHVDLGDTVKDGQILGEVDVPEMQRTFEKQEAQIERLEREAARSEALIAVKQAQLKAVEAGVQAAEARLAADRSEHQRIDRLAQTGSVTLALRDETLESLRSAEAALLLQHANRLIGESVLVETRAGAHAAHGAVLVAEKELEELRALMNYATLRAPFDGVVTERNVDPGDFVRDARNGGGDSRPLFRISSTGKVRVEAAIPEREAVFLDVGDPVAFVCVSLPTRTFTGAVTRKAGVLDPRTRRMRIEVDLPNEDGRLLPGAFGGVTVVLDERRDRLTLPADCVRTGHERGGALVYVVGADDTVTHVPVVTGLDDGHRIEIVDGLTGEERVVTGMLGRLAPNQRVKVIP